LPGTGDFHFYVPEYYLYAVPISVIVALVFLTYFGARLGTESRKRAKALNKLELTLAKEQELESIGHQAAAAVHSLGTPLSTITVIAKELKKEIKNDQKYSKDIDLLLSQTKRCGDILKKISKNQIVDDKFMSDVSIQNLLIEITKSFEEISEKKILLTLFAKSVLRDPSLLASNSLVLLLPDLKDALSSLEDILQPLYVRILISMPHSPLLLPLSFEIQARFVLHQVVSSFTAVSILLL